MTTRTYGSRYDETKRLTPTEVARLIRADIKAAVAEGRLPAETYSVRTRRVTYDRAIDVQVSRLRRKMRSDDIIRTVRNEGYMFVPRVERA